MIKAVLFDIDGVLNLSEAANKKFYSDVLVYAGYPKPSVTMLSRIQSLTAKDTIIFLTGENNPAKVQAVWNLVHTFRYPVELVTAPKGSQAVIRLLKKKAYILGLVTGRIRKGIDDFFEVFGERQTFSCTVAFEDYKNPKPHPEPILLALQQLNLQPEEVVYVGDAPTDRQSAQSAGVHFIGYNNDALADGLYFTDWKMFPGLINNLTEL